VIEESRWALPENASALQSRIPRSRVIPLEAKVRAGIPRNVTGAFARIGARVGKLAVEHGDEYDPTDYPYSTRHWCPSDLASQRRLGLLSVRRFGRPTRHPPRACPARKGMTMAERRKYSPSAGSEVKSEMHRYKRGTAESGPGGRGGPVKSREQAIAIGLSKARKKGKKVPPKNK